MTWSEIVKLAKKYPAVTESVSYGEPSLKVGSKLLTRYREQDNSLVILDVPSQERELLIEAAPEIFFLEPHYKPHDIVLVRLDNIAPKEVENFLERRWRNSATKKAIRAFDNI
ncbi:MAG: MmcQ/YjbR family DNA-binding protein [Nitratireductor sp.]